MTNLARFITVMKLRPLDFRVNHSYLLADRMEDITDPALVQNNGKIDRNVVFYGYMRGCPMKTKNIHIAGIGDFENVNVSLCSDPCELPDPNDPKKSAGRKLDMRQQRVYAPFAGVGKMLFDKDAVYLDVQNTNKKLEETDENAIQQNEILSGMQEIQPIDQNMENAEIQLVSSGRRLVGQNFDFDEEAMDSEDEDQVDEMSETGVDDDSGMSDLEASDSRKVKAFSDSEDSEDDDIENRWRKNISEKAVENFENRLKTNKTSLQKLIYDNLDAAFHPEKSAKSEKLSIGKSDKFFAKASRVEEIDKPDRSVEGQNSLDLELTTARLKNLFVSGDWTLEEGDAQKRLEQDDELYGDFEDLETGEKFSGKDGQDDGNGSDGDSDDGDSDDSDDQNGDSMDRKDKVKFSKEKKMTKRQKRYEQKMKLKEQFDQEYDDEGKKIEKSWFDLEKLKNSKQQNLNLEKFKDLSPEDRAEIEGFRPGMYVRIEVTGISAEFIGYFNCERPILIGGLRGLIFLFFFNFWPW